MQLRKVQLDFTDAKVIFAEDQPEYCHVFAGFSSVTHHLENFLMKAVRDARTSLSGVDESLSRDVDIFCQQEGWHSRLHAQFNEKLVREGYPWVAARSDRMKDDFDRFLKSKGSRFCLAYAEGFETIGPIMSTFIFERVSDLMNDWDEPTVYLWVWHFAEEYEHRTVCNRLYNCVHGDYFPRIYGLWYALVHLFGYSIRVANNMITADVEAGRIKGGRLRSRIRFARTLVKLFSFVIPRLVRSMSPHYNPETIPPPRGCLRFLDETSQKYGVKAPA